MASRARPLLEAVLSLAPHHACQFILVLLASRDNGKPTSSGTRCRWDPNLRRSRPDRCGCPTTKPQRWPSAQGAWHRVRADTTDPFNASTSTARDAPGWSPCRPADCARRCPAPWSRFRSPGRGLHIWGAAPKPARALVLNIALPGVLHPRLPVHHPVWAWARGRDGRGPPGVRCRGYGYFPPRECRGDIP